MIKLRVLRQIIVKKLFFPNGIFTFFIALCTRVFSPFHSLFKAEFESLIKLLNSSYQALLF